MHFLWYTFSGKESLLTIKASKVAHHFLTLMNDSAVLLQGEMRCWSLIECKGVRSINEYQKMELIQRKNPASSCSMAN